MQAKRNALEDKTLLEILRGRLLQNRWKESVRHFTNYLGCAPSKYTQINKEHPFFSAADI